MSMFINSNGFSKQLPSISGLISGKWECLGEDITCIVDGKDEYRESCAADSC